MTIFTCTIADVSYPIRYLYVEKNMDLRPSYFALQMDYRNLHFGNRVPVRLFRDGKLYIEGSLGRVEHEDPAYDGSIVTSIVGYDLKQRLTSRRFKKSGSSKVEYTAATEVSAFSDVIDSSADMKEGQVDTTTCTFTHTFRGDSCAHALEILMFLNSRECYVRNDFSVDFKASIGKNSGVTIRKGVNARYVKWVEDGLKVYNDVEITYNDGASTTQASDANSILQYGELDLPYTDLYSVTDTTACERYRDNALRDYKLPLFHAEVGFLDTTGRIQGGFSDPTVGNAYDVGDWVKLEDPDIGVSTNQRVVQITKQWTPNGEDTALLLSEKAKVWDARRYRNFSLGDTINAMRQAMHSMGASY